MRISPKYALLSIAAAGVLGVIAGTWKLRQTQVIENDTRPVVENKQDMNTDKADPAAAQALAAVPAFSSEAERERTRSQRQAVMPVFLKAADENIRQVRRELDTAKYRGAPAADIAALETRLNTMERVRTEVLARNNDIDTRDYKY